MYRDGVKELLGTCQASQKLPHYQCRVPPHRTLRAVRIVRIVRFVQQMQAR
ncbi:hypothetical protein DIPPA_04720 [Diplonema papillatum]|nr:hypothetical protein DIPPA_04720 [Diplonema papillatum]